MIPLTEKDVVDLNRKLIETFSPEEIQGVKEPKLLDSALNRPFQTMFAMSLYPDIFEKAVALFESLAKNHPFHNGNKRTAFCAMTYFLYLNDHVCYMNNEDGADLTVDFVVGKLGFKDVVEIIKGKTYRRSSWKLWLDSAKNEVDEQKKNMMMVRERSNITYTVDRVDAKDVDSKVDIKTKEEVKQEVFANAVPFDEEAFQFILDMYYDTFKELVHR